MSVRTERAPVCRKHYVAVDGHSWGRSAT
jgi:hypothetical protein